MMPAVIAMTHLGNRGPLVGVQGLGCMGMSEFYGATDEAQAQSTLERALELGINLFDTADMYGCGANEKLLATFINKHRDQAVVATKFGYVRSTANPDDWSLSNEPHYIRAAVDRSLQRLGLDCIDLYYMHRRVSDVPLADSVGAMSDLVAEGKVRWLGLSEVSAEELRAAHAVHPITALQSEWSLFTRQLENSVIAAASELGVALVPYAPLGRGLLTSSTFANGLSEQDSRLNFPRFTAANQTTNQALVEQVERLAAQRGITAAQLALAWLYSRAEQLHVTAVPIPGTRSRHRLEQNAAASGMRLSAADMQLLDSIATHVQGVAI